MQGEGHFPLKFLSAWVTQGPSHKVFKNSEECSSTERFSLYGKKKIHTFLGFIFSNCLAWDRISRGLGVRGNCEGAHVPALFPQEQAQLEWTLTRWLLMSQQQSEQSLSSSVPALPLLSQLMLPQRGEQSAQVGIYILDKRSCWRKEPWPRVQVQGRCWGWNARRKESSEGSTERRQAEPPCRGWFNVGSVCCSPSVEWKVLSLQLLQWKTFCLSPLFF